MLEGLGGELDDLARIAANVRASLDVLLLDVPMFDASQSRPADDRHRRPAAPGGGPRDPRRNGARHAPQGGQQRRVRVPAHRDGALGLLPARRRADARRPRREAPHDCGQDGATRRLGAVAAQLPVARRAAGGDPGRGADPIAQVARGRQRPAAADVDVDLQGAGHVARPRPGGRRSGTRHHRVAELRRRIGRGHEGRESDCRQCRAQRAAAARGRREAGGVRRQRHRRSRRVPAAPGRRQRRQEGRQRRAGGHGLADERRVAGARRPAVGVGARRRGDVAGAQRRAARAQRHAAGAG